jgi:hypothetical protein
MKIPPLPRPVLGHTLTEARRVLGFLLPPLKLDVYDKAVSTLIASSPAAPLRPHLDGATILAENDLTSGFKPLLLSNRAPMSHSMTITLALRTNTVGQISVAANLLTRLAMVATAPHEHLSVSQKGEVLNPEQTSLFLGTTRRVGPEQDTLVSSPLSRHVIVWSNGQPFALDVLNAARIPYSEASLEAALKSICDQASRLGPANSSVADSSWKLSRSDWFVARKSIEATESNRNAFALIDTALATIALEPFKAPADAEGKLEAIRSGHNSVNRYADQVVSIVVFHDGQQSLWRPSEPFLTAFPRVSRNFSRSCPRGWRLDRSIREQTKHQQSHRCDRRTRQPGQSAVHSSALSPFNGTVVPRISALRSSLVARKVCIAERSANRTHCPFDPFHHSHLRPSRSPMCFHTLPYSHLPTGFHASFC